MFGIGFQEILLILLLALIIFGPKKLPDLAKSLGRGVAEFKKAAEEMKKGLEDSVKEEDIKKEIDEIKDLGHEIDRSVKEELSEQGTKINEVDEKAREELTEMGSSPSDEG